MTTFAVNVVSGCLLCGQDDLRFVRSYRTDSRRGRAVFGSVSLCECSRCGLVQAVPRPTSSALADYYISDYRTGGCYGSDVADVTEFPRDNLFYFNRGRSIAELVSQYLHKEDPRILDVGAGYGHILNALGQRYPRSSRVAIEFSEVCVRHLESTGIEVFTEPVEEILPELEGQFDLIVISHVLEHLLEPREVVRLIDRSLAPGGVLYAEVPNIPNDSLLRYPDHRWAPRFDEPHITFFSKRTFQDLLVSSGFDLQFCDTAGPEYEYVSSLRFRLPPARSFIQGLLPSDLFLYLRRLQFTKPLRVKEREETFYQYGGLRIWIRSVSLKVR
jgi:SAM-dependent methyltransferase